MNPWVNYIGAAIIAVVSGGGSWATLQLVINRRGAHAEAGRIEAEAESERQRAKTAELERLALIADLERRAHDAAESAAERRYSTLERECSNCLAKVEALEERDRRRDRIEDAMLDAMIEVVPLLPLDAEQTGALRRAISAVRIARYELH